jgi:hypothetical protein
MAIPSPKLDLSSSIDGEQPVDVEAIVEDDNETEKKDPYLVEYDGPDDSVRDRKIYISGSTT